MCKDLGMEGAVGTGTGRTDHRGEEDTVPAAAGAWGRSLPPLSLETHCENYFYYLGSDGKPLEDFEVGR